MAATEQSIRIESRHAVFVNRFAGGLHNEFIPFLESMQRQIRAQLRDNPETTEWTRRRLNAQLRDVGQLMQAVFDDYSTGLFDNLEEFSGSEAQFEVNALSTVINSDSIDVSLPSANQAFAAVTSRPLVFGESAPLLRPFVRDWESSQITRVQNVIRAGFFQGQTIEQMVRSVSGRNGTLDKQVRQSNRAIVRTAVNHVSSVARQATFDQNDDIVIGYQWVSTLDSRTSTQCRTLDGTIFLRRNAATQNQPLPPIHIGCRSATAPILDQRFAIDESDATRASRGAEGGQQVNASQSYYSWLKTQPDSFVIETLGRTRGQLFLNGGLNADEFAKLSVDRLFRPLTLAEMRARDPMSFTDAGL